MLGCPWPWGPVRLGYIIVCGFRLRYFVGIHSKEPFANTCNQDITSIVLRRLFFIYVYGFYLGGRPWLF